VYREEILIEVIHSGELDDEHDNAHEVGPLEGMYGVSTLKGHLQEYFLDQIASRRGSDIDHHKHQTLDTIVP
jgi:hypothetical protein